jgi:hypothetical protein
MEDFPMTDLLPSAPMKVASRWYVFACRLGRGDPSPLALLAPYTVHFMYGGAVFAQVAV